MKYRYKGTVTVQIDVWAEDEEEAFEKAEELGELEVVDTNLEVYDMDDSDDRDYYEGIEYANKWENEI